MSRSGYTDDCEHLELYRATVNRALRGERGQAFLREMAAAMDAMPEKVLIAGELMNEHGEVCAIGAVCKSRGLDVRYLDYTDNEKVAETIGISYSMTAEIAYLNDEWTTESPDERWERMRKWVGEQIINKI